VADKVSNRRFIFWAMLLLVAGVELMLLRYYLNMYENYGQSLINSEINNFVEIAGVEKVPELQSAINSFKKFLYDKLNENNRLFHGIMNMVGLPFILGIIRGTIIIYALPLCAVGFVLGIAEGYISSYKRVEAFKIKSVFGFHVPLRISILMLFATAVGYILSPVTMNPYIVIYAFAGISLFLSYNITRNIPLEYM